MTRAAVSLLVAALLSAEALAAEPRVVPGTLDGPPDAVVDLRTAEGARLVKGSWRWGAARLVDRDFRAPGPDLKPSGAPVRTQEIAPAAGAADFDDSGFEPIEPSALESRRGTGKSSFGWYRLRVTLPERVGATEVAGATVVLEIVVDDYAEVWVNGELSRALGARGGALVAGFNAPNRVVLTRDARPGESFRIAVFAANGPLSAPPSNYIWVRSATLDLYGAERLRRERQWVGSVERLDPALDRIVRPDARVEKLAEGFLFTEGPLWHPDGYLLFSDPNANTIWRWTPDGSLSRYRVKSGYSGADIGEYGQPGSNGLALDPEGRIVVCEHGNRRVVRLETNGSVTVLSDRFEGKRLNSPNDVVVRPDGSVYFSDPPFGLPRAFDDPRRELAWSGVYRVKDGRTERLAADLTGPNGLAFSPDGRFLYVGNWDVARKVVLRYGVAADGTLTAGTVFFDMTGAPGDEALDGLKVDAAGNLFVSGPGGVWVLSPEGKHLGTIRAPELPANFAFGDDDRRTLYLTARTGLYRIRLESPGANGAPYPSIDRVDARADSVLPPTLRIERAVSGRTWVEGPVWRSSRRELLFSDIPENRVYRWHESDGLSVLLERSGYTGREPFPGREPGSNALALDGSGRLLLCQHGDRRVARLEADGSVTTMADRYRGRRLNSPNDLVVRPDGSIWFTDPPFGLPGGFDDRSRELDFAGVYRLRPDGRLDLMTRELRAPNGLAFSPDGSRLYVSNADPADPYWMVFPVRADGTLGRGRRFADARRWADRFPGAPDGMKTDRAGNLFAAGPGGVHVFAADGSLLGSILTGAATSNVAWGEEGSTLFVTADHEVLRIRGL